MLMEELGGKLCVPDVFNHLELTEKLSGNPEPVHPPMQRHRVICVYLEQRKEEEKKLDGRNEITSYDSSLRIVTIISSF